MGVSLEIFLMMNGVGEGLWCTFDRLEEVTGCFQASVGSVVTFGGETHGGAV